MQVATHSSPAAHPLFGLTVELDDTGTIIDGFAETACTVTSVCYSDVTMVKYIVVKPDASSRTFLFIPTRTGEWVEGAINPETRRPFKAGNRCLLLD